MLRHICKSKIHRATVTAADLNYEGSITIDEDLMDASDIIPYEKVQVLNINNGSRAETYVIKGERGSGEVVMNGAIARLAQVGDLVIILSYCILEESDIVKFQPKTVYVNEKNRIIPKEKNTISKIT